jgi:glycosyltransferase involved in cell wall biosynthesis
VGKNLRLLIGGSSSKIFHLKEFSDSLERIGVECKLVFDADYADGFPSRKLGNWFKSDKKFENLIKEFNPDAIFVDRQRHFGLAATKTEVPLLVHLRGNYWEEIKMARETLYKSPPKRIALQKWEDIAEKCFEGSKIILPICNFLSDIVTKRYPDKPVETLYQGISPSNWFHTDGMKLKHPCVGLLQNATIWDKTKAMLILTKVLEKMPNVTFYWVGDGPYRDKIIPKLEKFENFKWLGALEYPEKVRQFLSEIDVYALLSGIDMSPLTLQEAQLMQKPVVVTNVGGIPELMRNNETGFLIKKEDHDKLFEKLEILINNKTMAKKMGMAGREFISNNFSWEIISKNFKERIEKHLDLS